MNSSSAPLVTTVSKVLASPTDPPFDQLPKVVVAHLTFQKALSGDPSEGSLAYPIQSFLRIQKRSSWASVEAEEDHPTLKVPKGLGRPSQIDFVGKAVKGRAVLDGDDGKGPKLAVALETKLHVGGGNWGRIVRDIAKLLLLADDKNNAYAARYLLLALPVSSKSKAGEKAAYAKIIKTPEGERALVNQAIWSKGVKQSLNLFEALLPWDMPERELWLGNLPIEIQSKFQAARCEAKRG